MESDLTNKTEKDFESIKHTDENGVEFWYARELMTMLEYSKWWNFKNVIKKAELIFQLYYIWIMDLILKLVRIVLIVVLHQL